MTDNTKNKWLLFDWGNTLMKVFPDQSGPMKNWTKLEIMPHVHETLSALHSQWNIAVATNAEDSTEGDIREVLMKANLLNSIDKIFCYRTIGHKKPSPEFFRYVLHELNIKPEQVVMIGDDYEADLLGALQNGIRAIWYNPGHLTTLDNKKLTEFDDFRKLKDLLKSVIFFK